MNDALTTFLTAALDAVAGGRPLSPGDIATLRALGLSLLGKPLDAASWYFPGVGWLRAKPDRDGVMRAPLRALVRALCRAHQPQAIRIGSGRGSYWIRDAASGRVAHRIVPALAFPIDKTDAPGLRWYVRKEALAALREEIEADRNDGASENEDPFAALRSGGAGASDELLLAALLGEANARGAVASRWSPDALTPRAELPDPDAERRADAEDARAYRSLVATLDARTREVVRRWLNGDGVEQIAEALGPSKRTIQRDLERARREAGARELDLDVLRLRLLRGEAWSPDDHHVGLRRLRRSMSRDEVAERNRGYRLPGPGRRVASASRPSFALAA